MIARAVLVAAMSLAACAHTHSPRNAPGHVDVHTPPADMTNREPEPPGDPGEQMIVLAVGALGGGGVAVGGDAEQDARGVWAVGPEASLGYGARSRSHADDDFFIVPERGAGVNLGWTALSSEGEGVGPLYGELYYNELPAWLGAGWAWDPDDRTHGPQLTISMLFLYARATHLIDLGTQIQGGIMMKLPYSLIWSR